MNSPATAHNIGSPLLAPSFTPSVSKNGTTVDQVPWIHVVLSPMNCANHVLCPLETLQPSPGCHTQKGCTIRVQTRSHKDGIYGLTEYDPQDCELRPQEGRREPPG
ncbi:SNF2 family helicase/ATPase [Aspergillus luchuensis]|uniref:SNF2 family helicase/ATPase n=1 Tax=Aspergillus kawachii TaxID=1069201 RepID=A0A146FYB7_ASPKA|nr:SNF2 family helicase/ATPase [Aspergillus luchuensis]